MNLIQKSGPGSSVRSSDSATCTPRIRARWSARSRCRPSRVREVAARLSIASAVTVVGHHPGVAAAAALRAVDDERAWLQRDASEAARRDVHLGAGENKGPQVLMRRSQRAAVEHRLHRQGHHRLRDVRARAGLDPALELLPFLPRRDRPDEHPVAARAVDRLHDQLVQVLEHMAALALVRAEERGDVGEDGVLVQVVLDDVGHQGIHRLVVRHPVAQRIGDGDVAGSVGVDESGDTDQRLLAPEDGVQPRVVDAPVDDVDGRKPASGAHEHVVLVDHQVRALDELDPHLLREVQVLVVRGVVDAGSEQHHGRILDAGRRQPAQVPQQLVHVALDRAHGVAGEQVREHALHHVAVGQHVRDPGRRAEVVLEDEEIALAVAHQVDARDVRVDAARYLEALDLPHVQAAAEDDLGRDGALLQDQLPAVDVVEEQVQRGQPLFQARLEAPPRGGGDDPGDDVEWEDLLGSLLIRVDGERDAVVPEHLHGEVLPALELLGSQAVEVLVQPPVTWPWPPGGRKHLVVEAVYLVAVVQGFPGGHSYSFCAIPTTGSVIRLRVGCEFKYDVYAPTTATVQVRPRSDSTHRLVTESWSTQPELAVDEYADIYGNPVKRLVMPAGPLVLGYDAIVSVPDEPDADGRQASQPLVEDVPGELLHFTLPSRYVLSDQLSDTAWKL